MKEYTEEKLDVWHWRINVLQILSFRWAQLSLIFPSLITGGCPVGLWVFMIHAA